MMNRVNRAEAMKLIRKDDMVVVVRAPFEARNAVVRIPECAAIACRATSRQSKLLQHVYHQIPDLFSMNCVFANAHGKSDPLAMPHP
jgi:hypothetical protein